MRRVSQMRILTESLDEIDLADLAGHIRQIAFDKRALIDAVNDGIKIEFVVGVFPPFMTPEGDPHWDKVAYQGLGDAIDPIVSPFGLSETLTRNQFGQHVVAFSRGEKITIKDIVKYNANLRGGIHWSPDSKGEYHKLRVLESLYLGGIAAPVRDLKAIGRVTLRGLDPLIDRVRSRVS